MRWRPHCLELLLAPTRADANRETAMRQDIDRGQHLCREHRCPVWRDHDRSQEAGSAGLSGEIGENRQLVVEITEPCRGPVALVGIRIFGLHTAWHDDVISHGDVAVAQLLALGGQRRHVLGCAEWSARREVKTEFHVVVLQTVGIPNRPSPISRGRSRLLGHDCNMGLDSKSDPDESGGVAGVFQTVPGW